MRSGITVGVVCIVAVAACSSIRFQQRDMASFRRASYNFAFFGRHSESYRVGAAIHFAHGRAHDVPELTPLTDSGRVDAGFDGQMVHWITDLPRVEPGMEEWGPHTGQFAWNLYRAIDWTHIHHEQTYDILSAASVPWSEKAAVTAATVGYYLDKMDVARSPAPLDVTMRRAAVMMKPYTTYFRTYYPRSNDFFYLAHWWHPAIYEAMMIGGNGAGQDAAVRRTQALMPAVNADRPQRMLLSREMMPRYARLSPESANIFDNLHMLHGIAYDILAYEGWTPAEKRAELDRVIAAMGEQPGDRALVRKFAEPYPDVDPREYAPWMRTVSGEMNRIMAEMLREMWPGMSGGAADAEPPPEVWQAFWQKVTPGMQPGEHPGSLHEAIMAVYPRMRMQPASMEPGATPEPMVAAMLAGWQQKYGALPPVPPMDMEHEP